MFGKNKLYNVKDFKDKNKLFIKDIFYTLQGEAIFSGHPSTFIRLAYCNLKCEFCIEENQRVLMADFSYKSIKNIEIGDEIFGFEKNEKTGYQYFKKQKVLNKISKGYSELISLSTKYNELKCTSDHKILIQEYRSRYQKAKNCNNKPTFTLRFSEITPEFKRGWLAGYIDGDGNFHKFQNKWLRFKATSRDQELIDTIINWSTDLGYTIPLRKVIHNSGKNNNLSPDYDGKINAVECTQYKEVEKFQKDIMFYNIDSDNLDYLKGYISGFFDAEGCITYDTDIKIAQENIKNINKLNKIKFALDQCEIGYSEQKNLEKNISILALNNKAEFISFIQPQCIRKREALNIENLTITACPKEIISVTNKHETGNIYDITTETGNFICEGLFVHNCDTDFESNVSEMSISEIIDKVKEITPPHVKLIVLTGGEPLLQPKVSELIEELLNLSFKVQIETAGTVCPPNLPLDHPNFYIICSPKTGRLNSTLERYINAYKYIINSINYSGEDGLPIYSTQIEGVVQNLARPISKAIPVYISPMDEYDDSLNKSNIKTVRDISLKYGYLISLQIHKILDIP